MCMFEGDKFVCDVTGKEYKINCRFDCDSSGVVYLLGCKVCGMQYRLPPFKLGLITISLVVGDLRKGNGYSGRFSQAF